MAAGLAAILDAPRVRRLRQHFTAWWEGQEARDPDAEDPDAPLLLTKVVPPDMDPRLEALGLMWGAGRVAPGSAAWERELVEQLYLGPEEALGVFGPGLLGPLASLAAAHPGPLRAFEWRVETFETLRAALVRNVLSDRVRLGPCDLSDGKLPPEALDGFISLDEFTFTDNSTRLAAQITKAMRHQGLVLVEWCAGRPGRDVRPAFAAAFAEPHVRPATQVIQAFRAAGCEVEADLDVTEAYLALARDCLAQTADLLAKPPQGGRETLRELAWEAESWAARRRFLREGRLERRRLIVRRMVE